MPTLAKNFFDFEAPTSLNVFTAGMLRERYNASRIVILPKYVLSTFVIV